MCVNRQRNISTLFDIDIENNILYIYILYIKIILYYTLLYS